MSNTNPKTTLFVGTAIGVLLATVGYALLLANTKQTNTVVVLKLAHGLKAEHPVHQGMLEMQRRLAELSNGTMAIQIYSSGQLGNEKEVLEAVKGGNIAMTKVSAAALEDYNKAMGAFTLPYIFHNRTHYWAFLNSPAGQALLNSTSAHNLRGLCYYDAGARSIYINKKTNRAILKPDDLRGLKIRVMGSKNMSDMIAAFGGTGIPRPWGELYTDLQNGVVDGAENNPPSFNSANHYLTSSYFCLNEHLRIPDMLIIGEITWGKLSSIQRKWLTQAASESSTLQQTLWTESTKASLAKVKGAGVKVISAEEMDMISFRAKVKPLVDAARKTNAKIDAALTSIEALAPKSK